VPRRALDGLNSNISQYTLVARSGQCKIWEFIGQRGLRILAKIESGKEKIGFGFHDGHLSSEGTGTLPKSCASGQQNFARA
jgi:hypothetical protein